MQTAGQIPQGPPLPRAFPVLPPKLAYRIEEAILATGLSRSTLYNLMASGDLPFTQIRGMRVIPADALKALVSPGPEAA